MLVMSMVQAQAFTFSKNFWIFFWQNLFFQVMGIINMYLLGL